MGACSRPLACKPSSYRVSQQYKRIAVKERGQFSMSLQLKFYIACETGNASTVASILAREDFEVNERYEGRRTNGTTYLMLAVANNDPEIVKMLLPRINIEDVDYDGRNGLHHACMRGGHDNCVELLLYDEECCQRFVEHQDNNGKSPLSYAVRNCKPRILKLLLDRCSSNTIDNDGRTPLTEAVQHESDEIIELLLACNWINVGLEEKDGTTLLMRASARKSGMEVLKKLIAAQNLTYEDSDRKTILYCMVSDNNLEMVKWIFGRLDEYNSSYKNDIIQTRTYHSGETVLHVAAKHGFSDIMRILLDTPDIEAYIKENPHAEDESGKTIQGFTPVYHAIVNDHPDIVKMLLEKENIVLDNDWTGWCALEHAATAGKSRIVEMILEHPDIYVNVRNQDNRTPLILATLNNHPDIVGMLLANENIKVDVYDNKNQSALIHGCEVSSVESVKLLLKHERCTDEYVNHTDDTGTCALLYAAANSNAGTEITKRILNRPGTEVNNVDNQGFTALHHAMVKNKTDIVRVLLANTNLKLDILDDYGANALIEACASNCIDCVELFIEDNRCNSGLINQKCENGDSALIRAVKLGNFVIVRLLLSYPGVDCNITDSTGFTPLMFAMGPGLCNREVMEKDTNSVKLLLANKNTKLDVTAPEGRTALEFAFRANHLEGIKLFTADDRCTSEILNNAKMVEEEGTYLTEALKNRNKDIIEILVGLPSMDCNTGNPLLYAMVENLTDILPILLENQTIRFDIGNGLITLCKNNSFDCVQVFIRDDRCTPDILNKKNRLGETALMTAIIYGHLEIVELLAKLPGWHGIDYAVENKNGKSAMELAEEQYQQKSVKILNEYQPNL